MIKIASLLFVAASALCSCISTGNAASPKPLLSGKAPLPIFFFHGHGRNANSARNIEANLVKEGRVFTPLTFCMDKCSSRPLNEQVALAIAQIRNITAHDARYKNGYVFMGVSQGDAIARGVIEEMDDHKVKASVSLAGGNNGIFFQGPQKEDVASLHTLVTVINKALIPETVFNFAGYTEPDFKGKLQYDYAKAMLNQPESQNKYSIIDLYRSPYFDGWVRSNQYFPRINNINICEDNDTRCAADKKRRRANFLKLKEAHYFASPDDGVVVPWQSSHLAQYSEVATLEEIETKFSSFKIIDATQTREYVGDTYGLRTLDKRGGLFFHTVERVGHACWIEDIGEGSILPPCAFQPIFD
ncbi:hypothetical protein PybrP1_007601, partial [[Pythium] brassicae (nom. inval.)]